MDDQDDLKEKGSDDKQYFQILKTKHHLPPYPASRRSDGETQQGHSQGHGLDHTDHSIH